MNTEAYLDALEELLDKAWSLPLSNGKCLVDAEQVQELIDQLRSSLPGELRQAKAIVSDRGNIVENAKKEAETIIHSAQERAKVLVSKEEILKEATAQANQILVQTNQKAKEVRQSANDYVEGVMHRLLEVIGQASNEVRMAQQNFRGSKK